MDEKNRPVTRAIYNVLTLNPEGRKELLGMYISKSEGANFWLGELTDLQNRGVQDILIACVDGLKGFPDAIASVFPQTTVQLCIVHQIRNSVKYVTSKNQKEFIRDLKLVYQAVNKDAAEKTLGDLEIKWGEDYPIVIKSWRDNWDRLTAYFQYSQHIRRIIYTTNTVEGYHRQLRKVTKNKGVFTSDTALEKTCLSCIYENTEEVDTTGAELGPDGPATGHPVPGQVQDLGLTTSFVWSSLTILIT
jgi:transposase-like protein